MLRSCYYVSGLGALRVAACSVARRWTLRRRATLPADAEVRARDGEFRLCHGQLGDGVAVDLNEKSGWTERNAKREFYAHAHTIVGSEKSLRHALNIIRKTLAEAKRIRVKIEYEVVRREPTLI